MSKDCNELVAAVGRLQRAQPRNADVLDICEALLHLLRQRNVTQSEQRNVTACPQCKAYRLQAAERQRRWRDNHPRKVAAQTAKRAAVKRGSQHGWPKA
jgi:hypothetical protein